MAIHFQVKNTQRGTRDNRARSAISSLGAKAADSLACAKLHRTIADLEDEISLQLCAIGEIIYATHCGNPSGSEEIQKILEYVDDLSDEIEGHEQQLKLLLGIVPCPVCGADVARHDVYCRSCGQSLPVQP